MKKDVPLYKKVYSIVFIISVAVIILAILVTTDYFDQSYKDHITDFSKDWIAKNTQKYFIDEISSKDFDGNVRLRKRLPTNVSDNDSLCFESRNANLKVFIEEKETYRFESKENITGIGYGTAFHQVGLSHADSGKIVRIDYSGVIEHDAGTVSRIYISPVGDYIHFKLTENLLGLCSSVIIIFFGIMMLFTFLFVRNGKSLPFDVAALGVVAFVLGLWLFIDTNIPQLIHGALYAFRTLSMIIIYFTAFPMVAFFNSLTEQKRVIYHHFSLAVTVIFPAYLIGARYLLGYDMVDSFATALSAYITVMVIMILIIFFDNYRFCKEKGITTKLKHVFAGIAVLLVSSLVDIYIYEKKLYRIDSFGTFTRIGTMLFIGIMMVNFFSWWSKDQALIGRDRFVNRIMHFAVSSNSPDDIIKSIVNYIGKEMFTGRVILFEDQGNGKYHGTYSWCSSDKDYAPIDLLYIPYKGLIDIAENSFNKNESKFVVTNIEDYKDINPNLYNLLNTNHIENLIANPIEVNKKLHGIIALIDLPHGLISEASEIIGLTSYFLSQLLLRRDEDKRLRTFIYNDPISGTLNRRAYKEFLEQKLDISAPFGYFTCFIHGLSDVNKKQGFESGDRMVTETSKYLIDIFGADNVFRISGSKLVAFGFESEEVIFQNDIERFRKMMEDSKIEFSTRGVYCIYGTKDINIVINKANEILYKETEKKKTL